MFTALSRLLVSPANWLGLALAIAVLVLKALGLLGAAALPLALLGYVAGFVAGGLWLGFPRLRAPNWEEEALEFSDDGNAREAMGRALRGVRGLVQLNPGNRLPASLQAKVLELCASLEALLEQWERSKGALSLEEGFQARHIAISYLPDALKTYLSIPAQYASTRVIAEGKTAVDIFRSSIVELEGKVGQLADDLASQDAHAFLAHSQFLHDKFGGTSLLPAPAPTATPPESKPHGQQP
ncbi:MAG: hypothetical protein M3Z16_00895 [Pseudomonadota bacterium]|nr:hypothetical protein [Pseudomonadota bacterium]